MFFSFLKRWLLLSKKPTFFSQKSLFILVLDENTIKLSAKILIASADILIVFEISLIGILIPPIEILFSPWGIRNCLIVVVFQNGVLFGRRRLSWISNDSQGNRIRRFLTKLTTYNFFLFFVKISPYFSSKKCIKVCKNLPKSRFLAKRKIFINKTFEKM